MGKQLSYLIIGNGITGVTAAEILRSEDLTSSITIVADDPFPVYYRPALKDYLRGRLSEEKLWARPGTFYQEQRIRFVPGRVMGINTVQNFVQLHNGQQLGYHKLLLANGARPRQLSCPGLDLAGVTTLRTVADYQEILRRLESANRIVVCGSGTLALESAETLNHRGYQVTHLLRQHTLWSEVLDPIASDLVLHEERRDGIDVRTEEEIAEIVGRRGQVSEVITTSGARIPCDMVLIAIGIEPLINFIRASGVACGRGVKVDNAMRTNIPHIYAAGDVIETTDAITGRTRVLGQWYPAIEQARTAAYSMLDQLDPGATARSGSNYYNATFLYGLDFVSVGLTTKPQAQGYQEIIADPQPRNYRKVVLHNGMPLGILLLGDRKHALAFKRAIDHRVNLVPIASRLFADDFNLDEWLDNESVPPAVLDVVRIGHDESAVYTLSHLDRVRFGDVQFRFELRQQPVNNGTTLSSTSNTAFPHLEGTQLHSNASRIIPDAILATLKDTPALVLASQDAGHRIVPLEYERRLTIGRDRENDIVLNDSATSRKHAEIFSAPDGFYVRDLDSRNGVIVNKVKINNPFHLSHGDRIVIGNTLVYCSFPAVWASPPPGANGKWGHPTPRLGAAPKNPVQATLRSAVVGMEHRNDVQTLTGGRIRFEIDMCIGCDRCMSACPVPMSSSVNIADLNHATVSNDVAAHVARFTHECIMCGSCVPVCPVDNHRDLLMLSLKQRLGVSWDSEADLSRIAESLPAGWKLAHLIGRLRQHRILSDPRFVPENYLLHLVAASRLRLLAPDDTAIREGEYGRDLYLIVEGRLALFTSELGDDGFPVAMLNRGEHVGEDGMLTGHPYKATARAQVPTLLLQVPEQVMQRLMELVPNVRLYFDQVNNARSLKSILKRMALFQGVSDAAIHALIQQTPVKQYERNECLFAEDDQRGRPSRETLHILLEGFVKVARHATAGTGHHKSDERIIAYRQGGDYFAGGLDLLGDGRAVSVTAINRVRVAEVPRQVMLALFQQYPEVNQRFALRLREYLETSIATQGYILTSGPLIDFPSAGVRPDAAAQAGLHSLVSDGVVEGTEVLVIDLDKCIHCSECEEACARRHGHSRMNRKGMVVGNISIATACRQCQDPVCMLCSRAGIARHPNGEVFITESCIGCGICAERCPYGAISIKNVEDEPVSRSSWQRFSNFFTNRVGAGEVWSREGTLASPFAAPGPLDTFQPRDAYDEMRKKIAIKCDLCAGYKDQACVEACPTGAAIRIQPTKFFGSTEEILRRRAL
jgi:NADPH-dependent 2,4-dienoyl-CoA reductase/sulfur reductase-like enzyme/Fe-S-cluster-containing hydrogenase component 2/CRP-like cAMP-binding protein